MAKPIDPATQGMTDAEKKAVRKAEWKRPTKKADREKLRAERVAEAGWHFDADSTGV